MCFGDYVRKDGQRESHQRSKPHKYVGAELNGQRKINVQDSRSLLNKGMVINPRAEMKREGRQVQSYA